MEEARHPRRLRTMRNESKARAESIGRRIAGLSSEKRQILEEGLRRKGQTEMEQAIPRNESSGIPRRTSNEALPLSFAQQRIWFLDQFAPGSPYYNVDNALRIRFPLSVDALERSYNETVRRHEALRTTFQLFASSFLRRGAIQPGLRPCPGCSSAKDEPVRAEA